eukprot:7371206-Lingulodinium_polyedra.AAC.1
MAETGNASAVPPRDCRISEALIEKDAISAAFWHAWHTQVTVRPPCHKTRPSPTRPCCLNGEPRASP